LATIPIGMRFGIGMLTTTPIPLESTGNSFGGRKDQIVSIRRGDPSGLYAFTEPRVNDALWVSCPGFPTQSSFLYQMFTYDGSGWDKLSEVDLGPIEDRLAAIEGALLRTIPYDVSFTVSGFVDAGNTNADVGYFVSPRNLVFDVGLLTGFSEPRGVVRVPIETGGSDMTFEVIHRPVDEGAAGSQLGTETKLLTVTWSAERNNAVVAPVSTTKWWRRR